MGDAKRELPPGWTVGFNVDNPRAKRWVVFCATPHGVGWYECREVAVSRSWVHFGMTRAEYEQLIDAKEQIDALEDYLCETDGRDSEAKPVANAIGIMEQLVNALAALNAAEAVK